MNYTLSHEGHSYQNGSVPNYDFEKGDLYVLAKVLRNIYIPLVSLIGLVGNTISVIVFSSRKMKKSSSSVFLAALAVVDNVFLVSLLVTWIDKDWYQIITHAVGCQLVIYTTYVSSFLSVWLVVCFTYERFFAITFPLKINFWCSVFREKVVVVSLVGLACLMYSFCFWTVTTVRDPYSGMVMCTPNFVEYFEFLSMIIWVDTVLTMVVPFLAILFGNMKVVIHVVRCSSLSTSNKLIKMSKCSTNSVGLETTAEFSLNIERHKYKQQRKTRYNPQLRVTRTLLLVSTTFLVLNLPSHIIRLYSMVLTLSSSTEPYMPSLLFTQEITYLLYYTTFSCNFVLYAIFGRNFQRVLRNLIICKSHKQDQREILLLKLSSGHNQVGQT